MKARKLFCSLMACALFVAFSAQASAQITVDFESFQTGERVGLITTSAGDITVFGSNPFGATIGQNAAIIFDSANPTGGDVDLGTPNMAFGGPGVGAGGASGPFVNNVARGNLLIVASNLIDNNNDGFVDAPNDSSNPNTNITFNFSQIGPVTVNGISVIDLEPVQTVERSITFFDINDNQIGMPFMLPTMGNNGTADVDLGDIAGVVRMVVMLNESGAIDDLVFTVGEPMNGACCALDGNEIYCQDGVSEDFCTQELQGTFLGIGSTCLDDSDGDGVTDCFDLCPETETDAEVDDNGCQIITLDAGGPYVMPCMVGGSEMIEFMLDGSFSGQLPPGATLQFTWFTSCPPGTSFGDDNALDTTFTFDTSVTGCPLSCTVILTAEVVTAGDGTPFPGAGTPTPDEEPVLLPPAAQMGACCNRMQGGCTETTENACLQAGGEFFAGEDCMGDADADGVSDVCDLCPDTPAGVTVDVNGCQEITLDPGGPYVEQCEENGSEMIVIPLSGSFTGQVPMGATLTTTWSTNCAGATIADPNALMTTLTIDTSVAGCPVNCMVTLSGTISNVPGTPDPDPVDEPVVLTPDDMGACCNRAAAGCTMVTMDQCVASGGDFFAGENCTGDDDNDGISNVCDLCPGTDPEDPADPFGCAVIACDAGGPYRAPCTGGIVMIQLDGTVSGQIPPPAGLAETTSMWTTTAPNVTFMDPTDEDTIVIIDTAADGCPFEFEITISCTFELVDKGTALQRGAGLPPTDMDTATVGLFLDCNTNMEDDADDIANGTSTDCNANGIPDECENLADCNQNGVPDICDIDPDDPDGNGSSSDDCNNNETPDECEIDENSTAPGGPYFCTSNCDPDCNNNGVPDECDIDDGTSEDCNENGVPDECDIEDGTSPDCNSNGTPDECEIDMNSLAPGGPYFCIADCAADCNTNGIPDECDIDPSDPDGNGEVSADCQPNGIPDECDVATGDPDGNGEVSEDTDGNGIPDECEEPGGPQPVPGEACCMMNGECMVLMPDECTQMGGMSQGAGTTCETVNCCDESAVGFNILFSLLWWRVRYHGHRHIRRYGHDASQSPPPTLGALSVGRARCVCSQDSLIDSAAFAFSANAALFCAEVNVGIYAIAPWFGLSRLVCIKGKQGINASQDRQREFPCRELSGASLDAPFLCPLGKCRALVHQGMHPAEEHWCNTGAQNQSRAREEAAGVRCCGDQRQGTQFQPINAGCKPVPQREIYRRNTFATTTLTTSMIAVLNRFCSSKLSAPMGSGKQPVSWNTGAAAMIASQRRRRAIPTNIRLLRLFREDRFMLVPPIPLLRRARKGQTGY